MEHGGTGMMKDQKGTSLVSVIVSFAMLMVVMLLLQVSLSASRRYAAEADKVWKQVTTAENHYTNGEANPHSDKTAQIKMENGGVWEDWGTLTIKETDTSDTECKMYYVE